MCIGYVLYDKNRTNLPYHILYYDMPDITSLNTGKTISLPDWENGLTKKSMKLLLMD
jgi:hypothetical protein